MFGRYAYSLDGQRYVGALDSREAALDAAIDAAHRAVIPPATVFVALRVAVDAGARGHAGEVISRMANRRREAMADSAGVGNELLRVSDSQIEELDHALEGVVLKWLDRHDLMPREFQVEAISEYPLPPPHETPEKDTFEVHELGVSETSEVGV